ncbi:uncharacterized protein LACBIDRAFT_322515 [Laccaria bicolor S238N-H82]|uniref:Predicted protein n=1 Tax=Laccaria bicolor (strain S238N-H82 / ATCC MYA-4686) TaxID=486041 RepID=B0CWK0_LACBS|nr:uncharacterized protein LACBIDRAFT_322514 [Laccaria bicolor S238N-H82]XP_001876022.1 uncharacterized protein LACBIDRAFT_322515 [Laccaria bicolor S238N-H82]EDR13523.1 predicted protein [Laccaria bicolor S238N-H82]EDR13524.1 predicted protein [Laccaria bicolor S238N-H82]|eukprot:XP_001876021.1 predicted protein [Laccaria bicolor S238N-H82]
MTLLHGLDSVQDELPQHSGSRFHQYCNITHGLEQRERVSSGMVVGGTVNQGQHINNSCVDNDIVATHVAFHRTHNKSARLQGMTFMVAKTTLPRDLDNVQDRSASGLSKDSPSTLQDNLSASQDNLSLWVSRVYPGYPQGRSDFPDEQGLNAHIMDPQMIIMPTSTLPYKAKLKGKETKNAMESHSQGQANGEQRQIVDNIGKVVNIYSSCIRPTVYYQSTTNDMLPLAAAQH